ncbi:unnamed protein product [Rhizophagus irregularis]|nr:unnamed protein product [Rhizophagus irregularis]CAB4436558.1 unnamed protein product [Rhizophagus irregularis]
MGLLAAAVVYVVGGAAIAVGAGPVAAGLFGISQSGIVAGSVAAGAQAFRLHHKSQLVMAVLISNNKIFY